MWPRRTGKYNDVKVQYEGRQYDSIAEKNHFASYLQVLIKSGEVVEVKHQVPFVLYGKNGNKICDHIVDYVVTRRGYSPEVHEVKGDETAEWKIKHNLF